MLLSVNVISSPLEIFNNFESLSEITISSSCNSIFSSEKTKKLIRSTFAQLIKENDGLDKVTVSELVRRADINRGTFYNHYDSIYDIAEEFESEIIQTLVEDNKPLTSLNDVNAYFDKVIAYLKKNEKTYRLFLSSEAPRTFLVKLNNLVYDKLYTCLTSFNTKLPEKELKFNVSFFTDGIIYQVLKYFNGTDLSLDDISDYSKLMFKNIFFNTKG